MTNTITLDAETRTDLGKGASRRLRHANKVPAIVYGANKDSVSITLAHNKVFRAQEDEAFYSSILSLKIDGKAEKVLIKDMQRHPFKPVIMHIDFLRVNAKTSISVHVPVHIVNEEAVVKKGGLLTHNLTEISVSCLPGKLPEFIEVDVADLAVGESIHLSDIKLPKGVTSDDLEKGEEHDQAIVSAYEPKSSGESTETDADSAEAENEE